MPSVTHERSCSAPEIHWLIRQIRPLLPWHAASFLCATAGSLLALLTPLVLKWVIDGVIPHRRTGLLWLAVALMFVAHEGRIAVSNFGSYLMLSAAQKLGLTLRIALLRHLDTLSADYYEDTPLGVALYPLKESIEEISYFGSDLFPAILRILLTASFTVTTMFVLSPVLTLAVLPLVPAFLAIRHYFRAKITGDADRAQRDRIRWSNFLTEHLSCGISIQVLGLERRQERKAFVLMARGVRAQQRLYRTSGWFNVWTSLAVVSATCAVLGYGGKNVLTGTLSVGSLVAFYGLVSQLFDPLSGASELYARAQKTFSSIRQVQSAFALRSTVANISSAIRLAEEHHPHMEFIAVEFAYGRQSKFLRIPLLRILPGDHIAVVGENGAGKSTLVKLIARLYDPTSGEIRMAGEDLRNIDLKNLRRWVCYLPREPVFFEGTIASNLRVACPTASEEDIQEAIASVGLAELVRSLPQGMRQPIGPGACQLSGGERQRLAIARARIQQPKILILDEATSCLDTAGEAGVLRNLRQNSSGLALIVVSHRLTTLESFKRILILSSGHIEHDCDHDILSLLKSHASISTDGLMKSSALSISGKCN